MPRRNNVKKPNYAGCWKPGIFISTAAVFIVLYVLYLPPMPGIADQGDFQRIMDVTGLKDVKNNTADRDVRFFHYVTTDYEMTPVNLLRFSGLVPTTSMIYPIAVAKAVCTFMGKAHFSTKILAVVYSFLYITLLCVCLKWCGIKDLSTFFFISLLSLFILLDGNYLIWFNSLYGESMMIIGLLMFIASVLYAVKKTKPVGFKEAFFIFAASFLFLGAKLQCITALPPVLYIITKTFPFYNRPLRLNKFRCITAFIPVLLLFYTGGIYAQMNKTTGVDTKYNSVFYGILKNSNNPEKDLELLGLSGDLAVDAGKHAYLPDNEYVTYIPWSEITEKEFNQKISNMKLIKFYLTQPDRLLKAMEYTASKSFQTASLLGKYEKADVSEFSNQFRRFTLWSDFRNSFFPKKLAFIIPFFSIALFVLLIEYKKQKGCREARFRIELLLVITAIGILQFPMPYLGNGEADTAKQLFLFNYIFDIMIIVSCTWAFHKLKKGYTAKLLNRSINTN